MTPYHLVTSEGDSLPLDTNLIQSLVGKGLPSWISLDVFRPRQKAALFKLDSLGNIIDLLKVYPYDTPEGYACPRVMTVDKVYGKHITLFQCPVSYLVDSGESIIINRRSQAFWRNTLLMPLICPKPSFPS